MKTLATEGFGGLFVIYVPAAPQYLQHSRGWLRFRGFGPGHLAMDQVPRTFAPAGIKRCLELICVVGGLSKKIMFLDIMYNRLLLKRIYQRGTWLFAFTLRSSKGIISRIQICPPGWDFLSFIFQANLCCNTWTWQPVRSQNVY